MPTPWSRGALACVAVLFGAKVGLHLLVAGNYGLHPDELYYVACGRALALGYVDHPPLLPWFAALIDHTVGANLHSLRAAAGLGGGLLVVLTCLIARELGGRTFALGLAGLGALSSVLYLRLQSLFMIPAFEPVFWAAACLLTLRSLRAGASRQWLAVGAALGLGMLLKHSVALCAAGIATGLIVSGRVGEYRHRWTWLGGLLALCLLAPNLWWQYQHDFVTAEFVQNLRKQLTEVSVAQLLLTQLFYLNPVSIPLALVGLPFLWRADARGGRLLLWAIASAVLLCALLGAKPYYLGPLQTVVYAAGGVAWERRVGARGRGALLGVVAAGAASIALFAAPVLPLPSLDRLIGRVVSHPDRFTKEFHLQYGWREMARSVARVYHALPATERSNAAILAGDYGQASALNYYRVELRTPVAVSGHMSYYLWGPPAVDPGAVVAIGWTARELETSFRVVSQAAVHFHPLATPYENNLPILVGRQPVRSLRAAWRSLKNFEHGRRPVQVQ